MAQIGFQPLVEHIQVAEENLGLLDVLDEDIEALIIFLHLVGEAVDSKGLLLLQKSNNVVEEVLAFHPPGLVRKGVTLPVQELPPNGVALLALVVGGPVVLVRHEHLTTCTIFG
jgi:hypothetical protein